MKLRKSTEQDTEHWLRMRNALWPDSSAINREQIEQYFSGNSKYICECFLVEESDNPIGFVELNIRDYVEGSENEKVPYIEGWYVEKKFRGQGVGRLLIEEAEAWAKEKGYSEIASDAVIENAASISAHIKLGFKETERVVCFLKPI